MFLLSVSVTFWLQSYGEIANRPFLFVSEIILDVTLL